MATDATTASVPACLQAFFATLARETNSNSERTVVRSAERWRGQRCLCSTVRLAVVAIAPLAAHTRDSGSIAPVLALFIVGAAARPMRACALCVWSQSTLAMTGAPFVSL